MKWGTGKAAFIPGMHHARIIPTFWNFAYNFNNF